MLARRSVATPFPGGKKVFSQMEKLLGESSWWDEWLYKFFKQSDSDKTAK